MLKNKKLDIDSLVDGFICIEECSNDGFVNTPTAKSALHPARYFKELFMSELIKDGVSDEDIVAELDISTQYFGEFLNEKAVVTKLLAQRLYVVTGMPAWFWLRAQSRFDDFHTRVE